MKTLSRAGGAACAALLGVSLGAPAARAQSLPSEPLVFGGGRVTLSGDVSASYACTSSADPETAGEICGDDTGFFNYTDYEHSALRMLRVDLNTEVRATSQVSVLSDIRAENRAGVKPYGLYVRVRPWARADFDIQAGRIPPTFGAFARRTYANDNLLIGYPLAYQYLTSLRVNALPANADELLRMRGRGWLSNYSLGELAPQAGTPIVSAFRWDTGVQVHAAGSRVEGAAAVTTGSLGNPLFGDDNAGKQIAGRVSVHPMAGLIVGASAARAPFVPDATLASVPEPARRGAFTQTAYGADLEYSRGFYLFRFETILSDWRVPLAGSPEIQLPLRAMATALEGRYKLLPGVYIAARGEYLGFSRITGTTRSDEWEAPVTRVEAGGGYAIQRNLLLKGTVQHNQRDGGRVHHSTTISAQVVYWF